MAITLKRKTLAEQLAEVTGDTGNTPPVVAVDVDPAIQRAAQLPENQPAPEPQPSRLTQQLATPVGDRTNVGTSRTAPELVQPIAPTVASEPETEPDTTPAPSSLRQPLVVPAFTPTPAPIAPLPMPGPTPAPTPTHALDHSSRDAFVASLRPYAEQASARTGIPADLLMSIPLNEQGWQYDAPGNNLFGIKGSNPRTGKNTGAVNTWEDYGSGRVNIKDTFRAYDTPAESMQDFAQFLKDNPRYAPALKVLNETGDSAAFIKAVHKAGYATDPAWSDKILSIARSLPHGTKFNLLSARPPAKGPDTTTPPDVAPLAPYQPKQPPTSLVEELTQGQREGLVPQPVVPNSSASASFPARTAALWNGIAGIPGEIAAIPGQVVQGAGRAFQKSGEAFGAAGQMLGQAYDPNSDASVVDRAKSSFGAGLSAIGGALEPINPANYIGEDAANALQMTPMSPLVLPATASRGVRAAAAGLSMISNVDVQSAASAGARAAEQAGMRLAGIDPVTGRRSATLGMSIGVPPPSGADDAARASGDLRSLSSKELTNLEFDLEDAGNNPELLKAVRQESLRRGDDVARQAAPQLEANVAEHGAVTERVQELRAQIEADNNVIDERTKALQGRGWVQGMNPRGHTIQSDAVAREAAARVNQNTAELNALLQQRAELQTAINNPGFDVPPAPIEPLSGGADDAARAAGASRGAVNAADGLIDFWTPERLAQKAEAERLNEESQRWYELGDEETSAELKSRANALNSQLAREESPVLDQYFEDSGYNALSEQIDALKAEWAGKQVPPEVARQYGELNQRQAEIMDRAGAIQQGNHVPPAPIEPPPGGADAALPKPIQQAVEATRSGRVFTDADGNYHVVPRNAPGGRVYGPIASWNDAAREFFAHPDDLTRFAFREDAEATGAHVGPRGEILNDYTAETVDSPASAPATRTVQDALRDAQARQQERGHITTVRRLLADDPQFQALADAYPETYAHIVNEDMISAATERVAADPQAARARLRTQEGVGNPQLKAEALVQEINAYQDLKAGRISYQEFYDISSDVARMSTGEAQSLQMNREIKRMSPEGVMLTLANAQQKAIARGKGVEFARNAERLAGDQRVARAEAEWAEKVAAAEAERDSAKQMAEQLRQQAGASRTKANPRAPKPKPVHVDDFLKEMRGLFGVATGRSETLGMSIGAPPPGTLPRVGRTSPLEQFTAEEQAIYRTRAEAIQSIADDAERVTARDAFLQELADTAAAKKAAAKADRAGKMSADDAADPMHQQSRTAEAARLKALKDEADQAVAEADKQLRAAASLQLQKQMTMADAQKAIAQQKADSYAAAIKSLETQREAAPGLNAAALEKQKKAELQAQNDQLLTFINASARKEGRPAAQESVAIAQAMSQLRKYGAELPEAMARDWLDRARQLDALPREEAIAGRKALLDEIRNYDPVRLGRERDAAALAESHRLEKLAKDLEDLTTAATYEVKKQKVDAVNKAKQTAKAQLRAAGVNMSEEAGRSLLDRAEYIRSLPEEDQFWAAGSFMRDIHNLTPPTAWEKVWALVDLPKIVKIGYDLSYPFRQGWQLGTAAPKQWVEMFRGMVNAAKDEKVAQAIDKQVRFGQHAGARTEAGVTITDPFGAPGKGSEWFMGQLLQLPEGKGRGITQRLERVRNAAERAFTTASNKQRADFWNSTVNGWLPENLRGQSFNTLDELMAATGKERGEFATLAKLVNSATGDSLAMKAIRQNPQSLQRLFFAPGWFLSHFETPAIAGYAMARHPGGVGKVAAAGAVAFVGGNLAIQNIAKLIPGVTVEDDPRSSDYGDIRMGPVRINTWAGYSEIATGIARILTGSTKTSAGDIRAVDRAEEGGRQFRNKLNIWPGTGFDILYAKKDPAGRPVRTPVEIATRVGNNYVNLNGQAVLDAYGEVRDTATPVLGPQMAIPVGVAAAAGVGAAGFFGVGASVYSNMGDIRNRVARAEYGKDFDELGKTTQQRIDKNPLVAAKQAEMEAQAEAFGGASRFEAGAIAAGQLKEAKTKNEAYLRSVIDAGRKGPDLHAAISAMKAANFQSAQGIYGGSLGEMLRVGNKQSLLESFKEAYWNVDVPENLQTGHLDFRAQEQGRADVLRQAVAAGVRAEDVADRGTRFADPVVAAAVEHDEKLSETLKPYYEIPDKLQAANPAYKKVVEQIDALPQGHVQRKMLEQSNTYKTYAALLDDNRQALRRRNPQLEAAGRELRGWAPVKR